MAIFGDCDSFTKPPSFDGQNYFYWETKMRVYFDIVDLNIWEVIENGFQTPIKIVEGFTFPKSRNEWNENDRRLAHLDAIAKMIIFDALNQDEFARISKCADAKDMWNTLKTAHEEVDKIEESKSTNKEEKEERNDELNFCLMGDEDEEVNIFETSPSYEELQDAFEELHEESLKLAKKLSISKQKYSSLEKEIEKMKNEFFVLENENSVLEIQNKSLQKENENFKNHTFPSKQEMSSLENEILNLRNELVLLKEENNSFEKQNKLLQTENASLKTLLASSNDYCSCCKCSELEKENEDLKNSLAKFTQGRDNLNILLGKQRCVFDKAGLGYKPKSRQKYYKNFFVQATMSSSPFSTCFYCGLKGHNSHSCWYKKNVSYGTKMKWIKKETLNPDGPKQVWVPKKKC